MQDLPVNREIVRSELIATKTAFENLVARLSPEEWGRPTRNPSWTVGNLLYHLVASLELIPREVELARRGKGLYNLPRFLRDPLNAALTRWETRNQSLTTIADRYAAAHAEALRALDNVKDDEWRLGAQFWGEGFLDIEGLFRSQAHHFAEHSRDILTVLQENPEMTQGKEAFHGRHQ